MCKWELRKPSPHIPDSNARPFVPITSLQATSPASGSIVGSALEGNIATARAPKGGAIVSYFASLTLTNTSARGNTVVVNAPELGPFDLLRAIVPFGSGGGGALFLYATVLVIDGGSEVRSESLFSIARQHARVNVCLRGVCVSSLIPPPPRVKGVFKRCEYRGRALSERENLNPQHLLFAHRLQSRF